MTNTTMTEPPEARVRRAHHAGDAYDDDIAECRAAIGKRIGLHYAAHVTSGIFDFSLESPGPWPPGAPEASGLERASRQLSLAVAQLDVACEPLDSGVLIRMVIQGENGALFQLLKVAGQSFFGLTFDGTTDTVDRVDRELASVARSAAHRIGAASLRWGGFRQRDDSGDLWMPYESDAGGSGDLPHVLDKLSPAVPDKIKDACRDALDARDVHLVGIYRRGEPLWRADILEHSALAPFFQRVTPAMRRRGYDRLTRQVNLQSRRIRQLLTQVRSERLMRMVLDVARGAVYVLPLGDDRLLVAVTLVQSQVDMADQKVRLLHKHIRSAWPPRQ
jgi:hypothetical protein